MDKLAVGYFIGGLVGIYGVLQWSWKSTLIGIVIGAMIIQIRGNKL